MSDYDEKAEDAIDYEDIEEQYEGPEIQAASEEDYLLPKNEYLSADVSLSLKPTASVFDDENYDEEIEQEHDVVDNDFDVHMVPLSSMLSVYLIPFRCQTFLHCSFVYFSSMLNSFST